MDSEKNKNNIRKTNYFENSPVFKNNRIIISKKISYNINLSDSSKKKKKNKKEKIEKNFKNTKLDDYLKNLYFDNNLRKKNVKST